MLTKSWRLNIWDREKPILESCLAWKSFFKKVFEWKSMKLVYESIWLKHTFHLRQSLWIFISAVCGLGQAPNISNTSQCIDCEIGFYSDVVTADQCTQCSTNFSTVNMKSESAQECIGMHLLLHITIITFRQKPKINGDKRFNLMLLVF